MDKVISEISAMLDLFYEHVPDRDSNRIVREYCSDKNVWPKAHGLFRTLRNKNLTAIQRKDTTAEAQYCFEEVCAETLYNLTQPMDPFDPHAPYWVIKNALNLANCLNISWEQVVHIVARAGSSTAS